MTGPDAPVRRSGLARHVFTDDTPVNVDPATKVRYCAPPCGLPQGHPVHDLPQRTDEERAIEARRVGERA